LACSKRERWRKEKESAAPWCGLRPVDGVISVRPQESGERPGWDREEALCELRLG